MAIEVLEDIKGSFDNFSIDIIYSIPGSGLDDISYSLQKASELGAPHISAYALTFEKKTVLYKKAEEGKIVPNSDDKESDMYMFVSDSLTNREYTHYEISSFAKPGYESRHNSKYWELKNYIGLGPSSHSFYEGKRWNNVRSIGGYSEILSDGKLPIENEVLSGKDELLFEYVMTSLRSNGLEINKYNELSGKDFLSEKEEAIKKLIDNKMAELTYERFKLTRRGYGLADEIITKYF
jgi:oxygen-independent coproporphyrinogen-3 oxidase